MLSIIVTHNRDMFYLKDCLSSIAHQEYRDYETILVLDHTEDDIDPLLKKYKEKCNIKLFELEEGKSGVSSARNLGLKKALGDYICFLDNDDYLCEDTLKLLMDTSGGKADMVYGKLKHTWFRREAFRKAQMESEEEDEKEAGADDSKEKYDFDDPIGYRFERYRKVINETVLAAIYRRDFFEKHGIRFDEDQIYFSDLAVITQIFRYARDIRCNQDAIYVKRHHNDKANNRALCQYVKEDTMPSYFAAYDDAIKRAGDDLRLRNHLNLILGKFITKEYGKKLRWSSDKRWKGEFFEGLSKRAAKINKKAIKHIDFNGTEKKLIRTVGSGDLTKTQKMADRVMARRKLRKMLRSKRSRYKTISLYIFSKFKTKENWIVFESFMGRNCSGQPKYIYKYMLDHYKDKYRYIWVVDRRGVSISGKHTRCRRFGLRYYYYMNRSKYWINNMRQPLSVPRRDDTIMFATWHGTPLKRLVFDMDDVHSANPNYKNQVYRQTRGWDYLLSDNPFSTEKFQSCFMFDKDKILEYGYPANDPMYADDRDERAWKVRKRLGIAPDKKVIMYAPTWRDDNFYESGQYGFELALDIDRMQEELGGEYVLLLRMHYFIVDKMDLSKYGSFTVDGGSYDDVTDLYLISDILITDYSSVFFDYANLKRPILYFTYDIDKYRDVLRGFYLDMEKDLPGPLLYTNDELIDAIKNIDKVADEYSKKYEEFYDRFCCVDDGHAAERVVKKIFG